MKKRAFCALFMLIMLMFSGCKEERPPNSVFSLEDVPGKIIGALAGTPAVRLAEENGIARTFSSGEELLTGLTMGLVECVVMESVMAGELVTVSSGARVLSDALLEYELRFAVPRENAELLDVINSALTALEANGLLRNLRDKYLSGKDYTYVPPEGIERHPGDLILATSPDSPPYSFKDADGEYTGLDIEVARAICDYLGVELEIIEVDAKDLITEVWFGRASLAAGWFPGDIDEQVSISEPYANTIYVVVVRK